MTTHDLNDESELELDAQDSGELNGGIPDSTEIDEFGIPVLTDIVTPETVAAAIPESELNGDELRTRLSIALAQEIPSILEETVDSTLRRIAPKLESILRKELSRRLGDRIEQIVSTATDREDT